MAFKDSILTFSDTKIVDSSTNGEVMMSWEAPIMEKCAEFICHNKGDVLEIGFGMGICADYIQAQGVNSHTIVEIHPQIIEKLKIWADGKSNVTIVEGDWYGASGLSTYDGIFLDTYRDDSSIYFKEFALEKIKSRGKITYWNNLEREYDEFDFDSVAYEKIAVSPDSNSYTQISNYYYMPRVEF